MGRPVLHVGRAEDIGPALKDLRVAHQVTQTDVAEAVGMHQTHMGKYEHGKVIPNSRRLLEILLSHGYVLTFTPRELARGS